MPLVPCSECQAKISSDARACPHCGAPRRKSSALLWLALGLSGGLVATTAIGFEVFRPDTPTPPSDAKQHRSRQVDVSFRVTAHELAIRNEGTPDWTQAVVYINGMPPASFKQTAIAPSPGESLSLPLVGFIDRDGNRFNPYTTVVKEIWVGGGNFDVVQYKLPH